MTKRKLLVFDWNTWNYVAMCKQMIIIRYELLLETV